MEQSRGLGNLPMRGSGRRFAPYERDIVVSPPTTVYGARRMILESGLVLGDYEIIDLVGEGSMGRVYRARDRALGREVALKVLTPQFSRQQEQLARFQREARVLASLNHPNIATIHGLGKVGETSFIILELIEGDTLAGLISRGRLPVRQALELTLQLAEALEAAHFRGIVHRDLKPANIKVTEGKVKVLDFGIAKCFRDELPEGSSDSGAALDDLSTQSGVVLGTVGYMSPEQVRGESIDGRSDIWAFGCVLFELLTTKRVFRGKTPTDTLVQVLEGEPQWKALPAAVPLPIERLLRRCLRKERSQRLQAVGDARIEIEDALEGDLRIGEDKVPSGRAGTVTAALAAVAASFALGFFAARELSPTRAGGAESLMDRRTTRSSFTLPELQTLPYIGQSSLALTQDGSRLAYVVLEPDGSTRIHQRPLDRLESSSIPDTRGGRDPFFSPDGKWLGFFAGSGDAHPLQRLSFEGGIPVVFHEESRAPLGGVAWSDDNEIVFAAADGLRLISFNGGAPRVVACGDVAATGEFCRWPEMLPGGNAIVYTVTAKGTDSNATRIVASSIATGERRTLVEGGSAARFSRTGHLVYTQAGGIFAAPFDVERLSFTMPPTRLANDVLTDPSTGAAQFAISGEGTLAFVAAAPGEVVRRLLLLDDGGRLRRASDALFRLRGAPRLSPDGRTVALALEELGAVDIWLYDLEIHDLRRFTNEATDDDPVWSPDGTRIAFRSMRSGRPAFFAKRVDGETPAVLLTDREGLNELASWEHGRVTFTLRTADAGLDIWSLDPETGTAEPILSSRSNETDPIYSQGRLAFVSDVAGRKDVYVIHPDGPGEAIQVSVGGGQSPRWSRDGKKLFYRREGTLLSVETGTDARSSIGPPSLVWTMEVDDPFEILPGGGFVVTERRVAPKQIVVISNFTAEVPRVP